MKRAVLSGPIAYSAVGWILTKYQLNLFAMFWDLYAPVSWSITRNSYKNRLIAFVYPIG